MHIRLLIVLLAALAILPGCAPMMFQSPEEQRDTFRDMVRQNPDVLMDFIKKNDAQILDTLLKAQQKKAENSTREQCLADLQNPYLPDLSGDRPVFGDAGAPITIVEYTDFECAPCGQAHQTLKDLVYSEPGKYRLVLKHSPLESHRAGQTAAAWFEAMLREDPATAWRFSDIIFEYRKSVSENGDRELRRLVSLIGFDTRRVERRAKDKDISCLVKKDMREAAGFGFNTVPTILINGVPVQGAKSLDEYIKVIKLIEENPAPAPGTGRKPAATGTPLDCLETDLKS